MTLKVGSRSPHVSFSPVNKARDTFIVKEIIYKKLEEISQKSTSSQKPSLKDITDLSLCGYGLTSLPSQLKKLKNLRVIFLWGNAFPHFPKALLLLPKLQLIHMDEGVDVPPIPPHGLEIIQMNLRS